MKNLVKLVFFNGIVLVFMGCGGSYGITYDTKPSCARLICGEEFKGYTPVTLYYNEDNIDDSDILYIQQCKAVFKSGYEKTFDNRIDTGKYPDGLHTTITRPQGIGYSQDWDFVCSDTCLYRKAWQHWDEFSYLYIQEGKSAYDLFLEFKRHYYYSGACP